jgi:hypothetical protein
VEPVHAERERIQVRLKAIGGMGMTIKADPGVELQWLGRLLVPLLMAMVRKSILGGFQEMNQALKARAEAA